MAEQNSKLPHKNLKDISGQRFGKLTVMAFSQSKGKNSYWLCRCDCGTEKVIALSNLKQGTKSCGCSTSEYLTAIHTTHGLYHTGAYRSWACAKQRCTNPNTEGFEYYGGRGITMCEEWATSFEAFYRCMGPRPARRSLERVDNSKGYQPGNCRWATAKEQVDNRRDTVRIEYEGHQFLFSELSAITGIPTRILRNRYYLGKPLTGPYSKRGPYRKH